MTNSSSVVAGEQKTKGQKLKRYDEINWCDREEVLANEHLFDWGQRHRFETAETKRTKFSDGFDDSYFDNLIPIISANYVRAEKILCCCRLLNDCKIPCDQWSLCSKCAYMRGLNAVRMYEGTFNKAHFYHVTMSFDGDIPFDITSCMAAQEYWKANEAVIRGLLNEDMIDGAYLAHELHLRQFLPLRVLPHTHVVVTASRFGYDLTEMIDDLPLKPSVEVKLLDLQSYHDKCIRYLTKAIDLQPAYLSAWRKHCEDHRKMAPALNLEMKVFLDAQAAAFGGMDKIVRLGNLMPQRTRSFIGVKKADREGGKKVKKRR